MQSAKSLPKMQGIINYCTGARGGAYPQTLPHESPRRSRPRPERRSIYPIRLCAYGPAYVWYWALHTYIGDSGDRKMGGWRRTSEACDAMELA